MERKFTVVQLSVSEQTHEASSTSLVFANVDGRLKAYAFTSGNGLLGFSDGDLSQFEVTDDDALCECLSTMTVPKIKSYSA